MLTNDPVLNKNLHSLDTFSEPSFLIKKGYYENEDFCLARDWVKVCQTNLFITTNSIVNNVNSLELSKSKTVEVLNFPGATSTDVVNKMDDILEDKLQSLIVHVGNNKLTNNVNLLNNVTKIVNKTKKKSPNTAISFSNIIIRKDRNNLEKSCTDTNSRFCKQKNIGLIDNENLKENHLGIRKLRLNRKGNTPFAKNLLSFVESN